MAAIASGTLISLPSFSTNVLGTNNDPTQGMRITAGAPPICAKCIISGSHRQQGLPDTQGQVDPNGYTESTKDISHSASANSRTANPVGGGTLPRDAVHIVWDDDLPDSEIFYRTNAGDVFGRTTDNLSNNGAVSAGPAIAVSGNNVYVVWSDNTPGRGDIFYRRSIDGGATFSSTVNLSNNNGRSITPAVAVTGTRVYIVWSDDTPGNTEILYRRSMNSGVTFSSTLSNNTFHHPLRQT